VVEGRHAEAGVQLATAGRHYDAGVCFIKAGDLKRALDELIQVPESTVEYRGAARTAIRLLTRLRHATLPLAQYVQTFVRVGPASEDEAQLVLRWSELLKDLNFQELSRAAFDSVAARYPDLPEVRGALQQLGMAAVSPTLWASSEEVAAASSRLGSAAAPVTKRSYELAQEMAPISHVEIEIEVPERPVPSLAGVQHNAPAPERPRSSTVRVSDIPPAASRHEPFVLGPGAVIGERFRLEAELGQGGMATVYAATDLELEEEVAIKVFSGQLVTKEWLADAVARFREELKVCRKLRHPNIIQVYDIGIHGGHRYITMELLRGRSLHALLGAPLDVEWSTACLIQACRGLYAAHERGVVHRDVKPENIFITDDGVVKIMDFGIAKSMHNRGQTAVGTLAGTPEYMAPEQITGFSTVGPAADQYALGIVAYQMLTGQLPFSHEEVMPLLMMHREQTPLPLRSIVPSLPEPAEAVVLRMLAKQPEQRFESCAAAAQAIGSAFGTA
jgi:serine/threonine-protein kinase